MPEAPPSTLINLAWVPLGTPSIASIALEEFKVVLFCIIRADKRTSIFLQATGHLFGPRASQEFDI